MDVLQKRMLLFLIGCMGARFALVWAAKNAATWLLPYMGLLALVPAFGFMYIYLTGARKTGPEVFGGKIWWNALRPVHAALYFGFAVAALAGSRRAWWFLLADVLLGLVSFLWHHGFITL